MKRHSTKVTKHACHRCRGPLANKVVEHPYWNGSTLVALIQNVPAMVCESCGYHHFDTKVESSLHLLVQDYIKMGTLFPIPSTPYRTIA